MRTYLLLALNILFVCAQAQKNQIYFGHFELINLSEDGALQYSASKLAKTYIESNHEYTIVLDNHDGKSYLSKQSIEAMTNQALASNCAMYMTGEIHNLGGNYILSMTVYNTQTGEKQWSDMVKGASSEDLDLLLSRLGRTFMTKTRARNDIEIGEVTSYEQQGTELQQIKANHYFGVGVGGNTLVGNQTLSGFGFGYAFDAGTVIFNVNFDYYFAPRNSDSESAKPRIENGSFNMGVLYPLSRKRMTWFVQGGMDYSYVQSLERDATSINTGGVGFLAGTGYMLNRNSTVNLRIFTILHLPTYRFDGNYEPGIRFGIATNIAK